MSRSGRLLLAALLFAGWQLAHAGGAAASRALGTPGQTVAASGPLTLRIGATTIRCTIRSTHFLPSSIAKTPATTMATIDAGGVIGGCDASSMTGTVDTNTRVGYASFSGTLPAISGLTGSTLFPLQFTLRFALFPPTGCSFTIASGAASVALAGAAATMRTISFSGPFATATPGCGGLTGTLTSGALALSPTVALSLI